MRLRNLALGTTVATYALMMLGSYVKSIGARFACPDWPLCYGELVPPFDIPPGVAATQFQAVTEWVHRFVALAVVALTIWLFIEARRHYKEDAKILNLSALALGLLLTQVILGAATVEMTSDFISVMHLGMATAFFATIVILTTLSWNLPDPKSTIHAEPDETSPEMQEGHAPAEPQNRAGSSMRRRVADYVSILKPRIQMLLLVSALTAMLVAVGTDLDPWLVTATLVGGALSAGAGNAFNMYLERDIDALMTRTRNRPIPSGRVPASNVFVYGVCLAMLSFVILATFVNLLAAVLALAGAVFYVLVYTIWLKRTRASNIVVGGAAGSFPVLVGWAAVTGQVTMPALILGFLVFLWTPPHFWAIALFRKQEYAAAKIPMLPVVKGDHVTSQQIFLYAIATVVCSTLIWFYDLVSSVYLLVAMLLGALFVWMAFQILRDATPQRAYRLFRYSIMYLGFVFLAMAADVVLVQPWLAA